MNLSLFQLYLRRSMHPVLGGVLLVLALLAARGGGPPETALLGAEDPERLARGMIRRDLWFLLCAVLVPVQLLAAAQWWRRVRGGEGSWLSPRATSSTGIAATAWVALACGGALWLVAIGAAGELVAGGGGPSFRALEEWELRDDRTGGTEHRLRWTADLGELPPGSRGRIRFGILGDYSEVEELVLRATPDEGHGPASEGRAAPARRGRVEVELPEDSRALLLELTAVGAEHPLLFQAPRFEVSVPASERSGALALFLRLAVALAAWLALALGLGAWVSAPSAVLLLAILWGRAWERGIGSGFLPGADLPAAFATLAEGRVPPHPASGVWIGAAALVALGLALLLAGLRSARCAR